MAVAGSAGVRWTKLSIRGADAWRIGLLLWAMAATGCAGAISRADLLARIEAGTPPPIVDVRSQAEYDESHVPGAVHIPFYALLADRDRIPASASDEQPLVLYCEHGPRAGIARAQLWLAGIKPVAFMEGHMVAWKRDGLPVETSRGESGP